jgi:hypothetical protein
MVIKEIVYNYMTNKLSRYYRIYTNLLSVGRSRIFEQIVNTRQIEQLDQFEGVGGQT